MASPYTITNGGRERVAKHAATISYEYRDDPVLQFLLCDFTTEQKHDYLEEYHVALFTAAALNDGIFIEADDWSSAAVLMPPGRSPDNPWTVLQSGGLGVLWRVGFGGMKRIFIDYEHQTKKVTQKTLNGSPYFYIFSFATNGHKRCRGYGSAMIRSMQERATNTGTALWLEATTPKSRDLYTKLGFDTIEVIRLGKGTHTTDGLRQQGGEGVPLWCMIWRPTTDKKVDV